MVLWAALAVQAADEASLEAYLEQRLDVVESQVSTVYARGYDGSGRFWFVVDQHGQPLDAVDFATRLGESDVAADLRRRRRGRSATGLGLLGVGAASSVFLLFSAPSMMVDPRPANTALLATSAGGALGGLMGGTLVLSGRLDQRHPAIVYTRDEATERVRAYNARLRDEILGPP